MKCLNGSSLNTVHLTSLYTLLPMSPQPTPPDDAHEINFDQTLVEVEQALLVLKARYAQVRSDQQVQQDLQQELTQVQRQVLQSRSKKRRSELNRELKQIKARLEETELALESQLFSWGGLREIFWQAVRFGGLGIVVGWLLRSWAG
jgi:small-conductance mechanosensitive channel